MVTCKTCGGSVDEEERFCGQCGTPTPEGGSEPVGQTPAAPASPEPSSESRAETVGFDEPAVAPEAVPPSPPPSPYHGSKVELDPDLVNTLLSLYASQPGGLEVRLESGRLQARLGEHELRVNPVSLPQAAQLSLKSPRDGGALEVSVDLVELSQSGLEVRLRLL